jgi:hypothetical protein
VLTRRNENDYASKKKERIERAIADDLAFLAAHPVRRSNSEAWARRREFNEAMRQPIKDIAASRDLSDEEIKPVLTLKHHEIAEFTRETRRKCRVVAGGQGSHLRERPNQAEPQLDRCRVRCGGRDDADGRSAGDQNHGSRSLAGAQSVRRGRQRRSAMKRDRQRIAGHARRLKR